MATEPARPLADMLQSFMEESNIRWGEIIAGMLIVVSAVGLIISLRHPLQKIPYSSALLFMLFTVSFYGVRPIADLILGQAIAKVVLSVVLVPALIALFVALARRLDTPR